jgi:hypothetical protein
MVRADCFLHGFLHLHWRYSGNNIALDSLFRTKNLFWPDVFLFSDIIEKSHLLMVRSLNRILFPEKDH